MPYYKVGTPFIQAFIKALLLNKKDKHQPKGGFHDLVAQNVSLFVLICNLCAFYKGYLIRKWYHLCCKTSFKHDVIK